MLAEIITIGDELLIGQVVDTNSAWIAQQLNGIGIRVFQITSVSDSAEHILKSLDDARQRADLILITGGLGPTKDDITKTTLCKYFDTHLIVNEQVLINIQEIVNKKGGEMNALNRKQAEVPANCTPVKNSCGTAPGLWFQNHGKHFISMPGVPFEMKTMMEEFIIPELISTFDLPALYHRTITICGIAESTLAEFIEKWELALEPNCKLAYLPSPGIIRLRLTLTGSDKSQLIAQANYQVGKLWDIIPEYLADDQGRSLEEIVGYLLFQKEKTLATAESCTGGNIAKLITSVPGSSTYFKGSVVAYDNAIKTKILDVNPNDISDFGAVSQQVVEQMADHVRKLMGVDFAIATSGIAGPTGATTEKPVGTTWIAVSSCHGVISSMFTFGDNRERNITRASIAGLNMLRKQLIVV